MEFETGKFYRHSSGGDLSILCKVKTTLRGEGLLAESAGKSALEKIMESPEKRKDYTKDGRVLPCCIARDELKLVGIGEEYCIGYSEISKEDWMTNFSR